MAKILRKYGWKPQLPDHRDLKFTFTRASLDAPLPPSVDLLPHMPAVFDQGQLGSCTANSICGALEFAEINKNPQYNTLLSRLFVYFNERLMEGTTSEDAGAMIRDGVKSVNNLGTCIENDWPYNISQFTVKPSQVAYQNAINQKAVLYQSLNNDLDSLKRSLAGGFPFVFGISIYQSFESQQVAATGIVPMPGPDESCLGGHAVLCFGYDDSTQLFKVRNSWGTNWGDNGNFYLPYEYILNLASDIWVITKTN